MKYLKKLFMFIILFINNLKYLFKLINTNLFILYNNLFQMLKSCEGMFLSLELENEHNFNYHVYLASPQNGDEDEDNDNYINKNSLDKGVEEDINKEEEKNILSRIEEDENYFEEEEKIKTSYPISQEKPDMEESSISNNISMDIDEEKGFLGKLKRNFGFDNLASLWNGNNNSNNSSNQNSSDNNSTSSNQISSNNTNTNNINNSSNTNNNNENKFFIEENDNDSDSDFGGGE